MPLPVIAIVGRPNVGKSTLFNRLISKPVAITDDKPGITRDRNAYPLDWNGRRFMVVDTGGYVASRGDQMELAVSEQSCIAIEEADVVLVLADLQTGITDLDYNIRDEVLKSGKPYLFGVNKVDRTPDEYTMYEFYNLGLGDPHPVSGRTGRGTGDLLDELIALLPPAEKFDEDEVDVIRFALVGRPNVGKSSMVNSLVGREQVLVTDIPGTTRDSTDTHLMYRDRQFVLVDTAGLKRVTRLKESIEYYSYLRTQIALARANVVALVIDIDQGLTAYEKNLVGDVAKEGKGIMLVANKWDLVEKDDKTIYRVTENIRDELPDKSYMPILFTSALTGKRVPNLLDAAIAIEDARNLRIQTAAFNDFIEHLPIPPSAGDVSIRYGTQHGVAPPSFAIFVNDFRLVRDNFRRYVEGKIREQFGFEGTPIRLSFKSRGKRK